MNWIACALIIIGYYAVIQEEKIGFIIQFVGCLIYLLIYWGVDYSLVVVNSIFIVLNIYGYFSWDSWNNYGDEEIEDEENRTF